MNFKIENKVLNISNYPSVERHFEEMASQGWLISKIILQNIFIYKKIKPEKLDFSISPYEIETTFTRKSKEELEEFKTVCESVGWNYATKLDDLQIYFKAENSQAIAIETDEEEEFKTLESIGKKWNRALYFQVAMFVFLSWLVVGTIASNIHTMKNGSIQLAVFILPFIMVLTISRIININRFIKTNKKNIELGKDIEYNNSKFYIVRISNIIIAMLFISFILYAFYVGIVLKNNQVLMSLIPILIGLSIGAIYRYNIKTSRKINKRKKLNFVIAIIIAGAVSGIVGATDLFGLTSANENIDIEEYKVISFDHFSKDIKEDEGDLRRNLSFLVPESYEYWSYNEKRDKFIITEYANVLTEDLAKNLVERYKIQGENRLVGRSFNDLQDAFEEKEYEEYLTDSGLSKEEFNELKEKDITSAIKQAKAMIEKKSIQEDNKELWDVDEAWFLTHQRDEIVLRKGKEVFYLEGMNFSDPEIRSISKEKLKLEVR